MRMRRITKVAATAAALSLTLAACGGGDSAGDSDSDSLTMASWHWLEAGRGDTIYDIVSGFSEENPGFTMNKQEITRADYEKTLSTQFGAGEGPDIFIIPDTYFPELADAGVLEPLDDVLGDEEQGNLISATEDFEVDGEQLGLVWEVSPYAFFYNEKLLEQAGVEAPTTPEELVAAATAITEETGKTGFAVRHQMNEEAVWWLDHSNWEYGFGGEWSDGENLTINSPENVAAETAFQEVYDSGAFAVGDDASTFRSKFANGEIGMMIDCLTCMRTTLGTSEVLTGEDVGSSKLPFPSDTFTRVTVGFGINANSDNIELAKEFMRWFYSADVQTELLDANFPSTVGTNVEIPSKFTDEYPWAAEPLSRIDDTKNALVEGFELDTPEIRTIVLSHVEEMLTRGLDPQEALDAAQAEAEAAVGN